MVTQDMLMTVVGVIEDAIRYPTISKGIVICCHPVFYRKFTQHLHRTMKRKWREQRRYTTMTKAEWLEMKGMIQ